MLTLGNLRSKSVTDCMTMSLQPWRPEVDSNAGRSARAVFETWERLPRAYFRRALCC
jgi:hypothetical protein